MSSPPAALLAIESPACGATKPLTKAPATPKGQLIANSFGEPCDKIDTVIPLPMPMADSRKNPHKSPSVACNSAGCLFLQLAPEPASLRADNTI